MAVFHTKTFIEHDDYMTPKIAWENIQHFLPKDKIIWEAFYGDGKSGDFLKELGFNVYHEPIDFFNEEPEKWDLIVSNPPFSKAKEILQKLRPINKPFVLIFPVSKLNTSYMRDLFKNDDNLQLIIPHRRIHFTKKINGKTPENWTNRCNFDCFYYCYKMDLPKPIIWLDN
jgi:hypothetical protein